MGNVCLPFDDSTTDFWSADADKGGRNSTQLTDFLSERIGSPSKSSPTSCETRTVGSSWSSTSRSPRPRSPGPRSTGSLRTMMIGEHRDRDIYKSYKVIKLLGVGSMGSVSLVRKRREAVGGSERFGPRSESCSGKSRKRVRAASFKLSVPRDREYDEMFALKTIHPRRISNPRYRDMFENEVEVLRRLDHPNIVRAIETFEFREQLRVIVMEAAIGGNLHRRDPYSEKDAAKILRKLLSAVSYMHNCCIMHRDIKYENILFENESPDAEIKLVDFGLSKTFRPGVPIRNESAGTIYTVAPQVIERQERRYTCKADLWSVGVVAFMLLSSQRPFTGTSDIMYDKIIKCEYSFRGIRWRRVSDEAKEMVTALLQREEADRPTADEALNFSWFNDGPFDGKDDDDYVFSTAIRVQLEKYSKYAKIAKLALMVIAHRSTSKEIGALRDVFGRCGGENTGTISYPEFRKAFGIYGYSKDGLKDIFQGVDLDGSGSIDYTEFLAATLEANGAIAEERLAEAFDRFDCDDSGCITKGDLKNFLSDGFEGCIPSESLIQDIIDEADFNNDGLVSYEEFLMLWDSRERDQRQGAEKTSSLERLPSATSGLQESSASVHW